MLALLYSIWEKVHVTSHSKVFNLRYQMMCQLKHKQMYDLDICTTGTEVGFSGTTNLYKPMIDAQSPLFLPRCQWSGLIQKFYDQIKDSKIS